MNKTASISIDSVANGPINGTSYASLFSLLSSDPMAGGSYSEIVVSFHLFLNAGEFYDVARATRNTKCLGKLGETMDLGTAASYAEIIGLVTILGAAIYSWFQIREMKASRDSAAALILSEHFHRPEWVAGVVELVYQPKDINSLEKFKEYHGERWPDLMAVMTTWESMGALVHRGDLDFHLVYDIYSGLILSTHENCQPLIQGERDRFDTTRFEWFTWLADRIIEFKDSQRAPVAAFVEHQDWKPPVRKPD